jgi:hypothetical protein
MGKNCQLKCIYLESTITDRDYLPEVSHPSKEASHTRRSEYTKLSEGEWTSRRRSESQGLSRLRGGALSVQLATEKFGNCARSGPVGVGAP